MANETVFELTEGEPGMLIDVSMPITDGSVFRLGTPPVDIARRRFYHESEGDYKTVMLSMAAHTATHVDLVVAENRIEPERMIGRGKLIVATAGPGSEVRLADIQHQVEVESGDFVFLRTGWSEFVHTEKYYDHPELSPRAVQWLASRRVNAVGIDALGLGRGRRHAAYDKLLIENDIFVIENLVNLGAIPSTQFTVYCFPLRMENVDAIPARVVVEIAEPG